MKTCDFPAYTIADLIKTRQISAVEVLEETLDRVRAVDGRTGQVDGSQAQSKEDLSSVHAFTILADEPLYSQRYLYRERHPCHSRFKNPIQLRCSLHGNGRRADGGSWRRDDRKS